MDESERSGRVMVTASGDVTQRGPCDSGPTLLIAPTPRPRQSVVNPLAGSQLDSPSLPGDSCWMQDHQRAVPAVPELLGIWDLWGSWTWPLSCEHLDVVSVRIGLIARGPAEH